MPTCRTLPFCHGKLVNEALEANEVLDCWDVVMILINGEGQWEVICGHNKTICGKVTVTIVDSAPGRPTV